MIFFISFSAQAIASFVDVPVTALASMIGKMNEFVINCTRSLGGAGHPYAWYWTPADLSAAYLGSVYSTAWSWSFSYTGRLKASPDMMYSL